MNSGNNLSIWYKSGAICKKKELPEISLFIKMNLMIMEIM